MVYHWLNSISIVTIIVTTTPKKRLNFSVHRDTLLFLIEAPNSLYYKELGS